MKVTCPGCSRNYKVDDNRIPETGLKMRCPHCSASFTLMKSGPGETVFSIAPQSTTQVTQKGTKKAILPRRPTKPSRTIDMEEPKFDRVDIAPDTADSTDIDVETEFGSMVDDFDSDESKTEPADSFGELDLGIEPKSGVRPQTREFPENEGSDPFIDIDIPTPTGSFDVSEIKDRVAQPTTKELYEKAASIGQSDPFSGISLSSTTQSMFEDKAAKKETENTSAEADPLGDIDLPAALGFGPSDLPAVKTRSGSDSISQSDPFSGISLPPITQSALPESAAIGVSEKSGVQADPFGEIDLPASLGSGASDLPAVKTRSGSDSISQSDPFSGISLPPITQSALPESAAIGVSEKSGVQADPFGEIDLPASLGSGVPAATPLTDKSASASMSQSDPFSGINMPDPSGTFDLPLVKEFSGSSISGSQETPVMGTSADPFGGIGDIDLPTPASFVSQSQPPQMDSFPSTDLSPPPAPKTPFAEASGEHSFGSVDLFSPGQFNVPTGSSDEPSGTIFPQITDLGKPRTTGALPPIGSMSSLQEAVEQKDLDEESLSLPPLVEAFYKDEIPEKRPAGGTVRVQSSGSTDFGQIDLTSSRADDQGEFAEFPLDEEAPRKEAPPKETGKGRSGLDLATDPYERAQATEEHLVDEPVEQEKDFASAGERRAAAAFEGRRKYERRALKTKMVLLVGLGLFILIGSSLYFTSLGPFGAYAIAKMIPSLTEAKVVGQLMDKLGRRINRDTIDSMEMSLKDFEISRKEMDENEDLQLFGAFLYSWRLIRFGADPKAEAAAIRLLGATNLQESDSPVAPLARAAQLVYGGKPKEAVNSLKGENSFTTNGLAIIALAHLVDGNYEKALEAATKLQAKENSVRSGFFMAWAYAEMGSVDKAIDRIERIQRTTSEHADSALLMAELLMAKEEPDQQRLQKLLGSVCDLSSNKSSNTQRARAHSLLGRMHMINRHYTKAGVEFDEAEKLKPTDVVMLIGKGDLALINDNLSIAATYFSKASVEDPGNINIVLSQIETEIRQGMLSEAKSKLLEILPKNQKSARAHYLLGRVETALKNYDVAEREYGTAIALDNKYLEAYVSLSELYIKTDRDREAMRALNEASETVPGSPLINQTLAQAHEARGDYASAIIELNNALDLDPDNVRTHFMMAQMYRKMDAIEDARRALQEVEMRNPSYPGLTLEQGLMMEASGSVKEALNAYERALAANPNDLGLKIRVGAASHIIGDNDRAEILLSEVLAAKPESAEANFFMGEVLRTTGRSAEAITLLKNATTFDENNALYHLRYGMAMVEIRDVAQAMREYELALKLDPKLTEAYVRVGQIKMRDGSVKDAIASFEKALEIDPKYIEPYGLIGEAMEQLYDIRTAVQYYRKAVSAAPNDGNLQFKLGLAEYRVSGDRAALGSLAKAVSLGEKEEPKPSWLPEALYLLGTAQMKTGSKASARTSFNRYMEIAPKDHMDMSEVRAQLEILGG